MFLTKKEAVFTVHFIYFIKKKEPYMNWNRNLLFIFLMWLGIHLTSCTQEEDELIFQSGGNGTFSTLGTITNTARLTVHSDSYGVLLPVNNDIFIQNKANTLGQRVLLEVLFLDNQQKSDSLEFKEVEVISLYKVLTKDANLLDPQTNETAVNDTFGTAPIVITSATLSPEHLNIQYEINGYDKNISHRISLLVAEDAQPDSQGLLPVTLRHHPETDWEINTFWGVVSFNLASIPQYSSPDFKGFRIYYKKKDGSETSTTVTSKNNS